MRWGVRGFARPFPYAVGSVGTVGTPRPVWVRSVRTLPRKVGTVGARTAVAIDLSNLLTMTGISQATRVHGRVQAGGGVAAGLERAAADAGGNGVGHPALDAACLARQADSRNGASGAWRRDSGPLDRAGRDPAPTSPPGAQPGPPSGSWSRSRGSAGRSRTRSRPRRPNSASTTTKAVPGTAGTATSRSSCWPSPCWRGLHRAARSHCLPEAKRVCRAIVPAAAGAGRMAGEITRREGVALAAVAAIAASLPLPAAPEPLSACAVQPTSNGTDGTQGFYAGLMKSQRMKHGKRR